MISMSGAGRLLISFFLALAFVGCVAEADADGSAEAQQLARELLEDTSEFQEGMIEDLEVTRQEYEAAHDAFFDCMDTRGWSGKPEDSPNGITYDLTFSVRPDEEFDDDFAECEDEYLVDVVKVYRASLVVSEDSVEQVKDELMRCLEEAGVDSADRDWSDGELASHLDDIGAPHAAWVCREVALARLGPR